MSDVLLVKRRDKVLIVSNSETGKKWMEENLILDTSSATLVDSESIDDTIKLMEKAEVTYEF